MIEESHQGIVAACKVIKCARRLRHSAYIGSLAARHTELGKGLGRDFFGNVFSMLCVEGYSRLELLVAADNEKAISLFTSFGFVIEGTHKNCFSRSGTDQLFDEHTRAWVENT